jgi:hypothetical protein
MRAAALSQSRGIPSSGSPAASIMAALYWQLWWFIAAHLTK